MREDLLTALQIHLEAITVDSMMPLVLPVQILIVLKELSDSKEAMTLKEEWRSATTISGALCAVICLILLMLELPADS